jgi:hypothetical protein
MMAAVRRASKAALGAIFENFGWKLLSLAAATAIWALVATEPELSTFATSQVEYRNLPDNIDIDSQPVTSVLLELRGPSGVLQNLANSTLRPQVILDMSGAASGQRTFAIGDGAVKLPRGVRLVSAIPAQVRVTFDRRAAAVVPVNVPISGDGSGAYAIESRRILPARLTIVGPAGHVARITQVSTDPVDVSAKAGTAQYRVNAFLDDPYVRFQSSPQVEVDITMKKK